MESVETVIAEIKAGKVSLYSSIVEKFQRPLFIYCYQLLGQIQEAEDAVQDVFLKAYEKLKMYDSSISFSAWLYKISYNHCISILRRKRLLKFLPLSLCSSKTITQVGKADGHELNEKLQIALTKISTADRSILFLRVFEDKSYEDIAGILGMKAPAVRKRYERARKKLILYLNKVKGEIENGMFATN